MLPETSSAKTIASGRDSPCRFSIWKNEIGCSTSVGIDFEIFLTQVANRTALGIDRGDVDRYEIGVEAQYVFRFLLFGKDFARSLSLVCRVAWF